MHPALPLQQTLRQHHYSFTKTRQIVFVALQHQEPQTIYQLINRAKGVDRASVYRTVALFEALGIVQRLQTGWKYKLELSDQFHDHHHHATCLACGASIALPEDKQLERRLDQLSLQHGFRLERHQIELQGTCKSCLETA